MSKLIVAVKGGKGSGFRGHAGRPGKRGGSAATGSSSKPKLLKPYSDYESGEFYDSPQVATSVGPVENDMAPLVQTLADAGIKTTACCTGHLESEEDADGPYIEFASGKFANMVKSVVDKLKTKFDWLFVKVDLGSYSTAGGLSRKPDTQTYTDKDKHVVMRPDWNDYEDDRKNVYLMEHGQANVLKNLRSDLDTIMRAFGGNYKVKWLQIDPAVSEEANLLEEGD